MLTHFQCDMFQFITMKGIELTEGSNKDERLIISIMQASLDLFWSREPRTVRDNLTTLRNLVKMAREELGLEYWFPPLVS